MVHRKKTRINDIRTRFIRTSFFSLSLRSTEDHSTQQTWNEFRAREEKTPKERRRKNRKTVGEKNSVVMCCACFYIIVCVLLIVRCCCCCSMVYACVCVCESISSDRSLSLYCITMTCMYLCYLSELLKPKHDRAMIKCLRINAKEMDWTMMMMMGACVEFVFVLCMRCDSVGFVWCRSIQSHCIPCILYNTQYTPHSFTGTCSDRQVVNCECVIVSVYCIKNGLSCCAQRYNHLN